jgi:hypothetical protein
VTGPLTATFDADGTFRITEKDQVVVTGTYRVSNDRIWISDKEGRYACAQSGPGEYQWKSESDRLSFVRIDDDCEGRIKSLTSQPLVRQK